VTTKFIQENEADLLPKIPHLTNDAVILACIQKLIGEDFRRKKPTPNSTWFSSENKGFRVNTSSEKILNFTFNNQEVQCKSLYKDGSLSITINGQTYNNITYTQLENNELAVLVENYKRISGAVVFLEHNDSNTVFLGGEQ